VNGGTPAVADGLAVGKAVLVEALTTFFLVWAVFATAVDERGPFAKLAGLTIGLTITIDIFATGGLTGAAMNPARWFGPALATSDWTNWWVWIVGPIAGGIIAAVAYWYLFLRDTETVTP
jgi:aquaporin Z